MKNADIKRLMKIGKSKSMPIIDKTAYICNGWATSTDLEITLSVPTDIKGEGVIDLTPLSKMQGGYDSAEIMDGYLFVKKGNASSKYKLAGQIDEFPVFPACNEGVVSLSQSDADAIASLVPFTGDDEVRPYFGGVYASDNFVATDAHKLRWLPNNSALRGVIIPKAAALLIAPGVVSLGESENGSKYAEVISEQQILNFRLIDCKYPDYEAVIPKDNPIRLEVKTGEFIAALKNALPSANKQTNQIQLIAEGGNVFVSAEDLDTSREYSEKIPARFTGAKFFPIGVNGAFMLLALDKSLEITTLEMSAPNRAMIVNENTLVMPVMLNKDLKPVYNEIGKGSNNGAEKMLETLLVKYRKSERDMSFHISQTLAGDGCKDFRQILVEHLTGQSTPKAECGITKLEELCKARFDEIIAAETPATPEVKQEPEAAEPVEETPAEVVEETPIQPERKIGEIIIARMPQPEPEPGVTEPETPEIIEEETPAEPVADAEPEADAQGEDMPELLTVIENVTEKAFGVVGFIDLLPEDFKNKYGSKCRILVGDERREGLLFSKKRRAQLDEAIAEIGVSYHVA